MCLDETDMGQLGSARILTGGISHRPLVATLLQACKNFMQPVPYGHFAPNHKNLEFMPLIIRVHSNYLHFVKCNNESKSVLIDYY